MFSYSPRHSRVSPPHSRVSPRHSREGGNPVVSEKFILGSRLRGNDAQKNDSSEDNGRVVTFNNNKGLTLIELLIVLVISSFIVSGLFKIYLQAKDHHIKNNALQEIGDEMGFVDRLLAQAIYGAGYLGYSNWRVLSVYDNTQAKEVSNFMTIWEAGEPNLPENIQKKIKSGTQALELKQMNFVLTSLSEKVTEKTSTIMTIYNDALDWENGSLIIIADAKHAEINQIVSMRKSGNKKSVQLVYPLSYSYDAGSYVGEYFDRLYFVGETGRIFPDKTPIYGLYVNSENGMTEEITGLVSDIHVSLEGFSDGNSSAQSVLKTSMTLTAPYWVNGKNYSREQEFYVAFRE